MSNVQYLWRPDPSTLANAIFNVAAALEDRAPALGFAAEQTLADVRERFLTETDPDGNKWANWAESYKPRAEAYPNKGILRRTEELYDAATNPNTVVISGSTLWYETSRLPPRGAWHQEGRPARKTASGSPNPLPARPFLGLSAEASAVIFQAFGEWFDRAIVLYPTSTGKIGRRHALRGAGGRFIPRMSPMLSRIG